MEPLEITLQNPSYALHLFHYLLLSLPDSCLRELHSDLRLFSYRISRNTIAGIIWHLRCHLECSVEKNMPFPTAELIEKSAKEYEHLWKFPNCDASIDDKHVGIKCPKLSRSRYFNYKGFFSVILQGLVDARNKLSVGLSACSRQSDSRVFFTIWFVLTSAIRIFPFSTSQT